MKPVLWTGNGLKGKVDDASPTGLDVGSIINNIAGGVIGGGALLTNIGVFKPAKEKNSIP